MCHVLVLCETPCLHLTNTIASKLTIFFNNHVSNMLDSFTSVDILMVSCVIGEVRARNIVSTAMMFLQAYFHLKKMCYYSSLMQVIHILIKFWYLVLLFFKKGRGFAIDIDRFLLFFLSMVGYPFPFI